MNTLHVLKSQSDETTKELMRLLSEGEETTEFELYNGQQDYGKLIDMIFDHEKVISWW